MLLVHGPHAFIFVAVLVELDAEALLAIISPVTDVSAGSLPDLTLDGAILLSWLLFDPVNTSMGSIFLGLGISHLPEMDERGSLLEYHRVLTVFIVLLTIHTLVLLLRI
jgi:hypothetical protein